MANTTINNKMPKDKLEYPKVLFPLFIRIKPSTIIQMMNNTPSSKPTSTEIVAAPSADEGSLNITKNKRSDIAIIISATVTLTNKCFPI